MTFARKISFSIILSLLSLALILIIGEGAARLVFDIQPAQGKIRKPPYDTPQKDDILGWKMTPNYTYKGTVKDVKGEKYPVELSYNEHGFKAFGDPYSTKKKIFFIGDSFTSCIEVSNNKSFFNLVKDSLDVEVFAYGQSGYGNLQQFMILEKFYKKINPDVVIWQLSANDFVDNFADLERESSYKVGERRPYLDLNNAIVYEQPISTLKKLSYKSAFINLIQERWKNVSYNYLEKDKKVAEYWIKNKNKNYFPYSNSIKVTNLIFDKVEALISQETRVIGFPVGWWEPQGSDFKKIFLSHGFEFTMKPGMNVFNAKESGEIINSIDGYHWNEKGHQLVSDGIIEALITQKGDSKSSLE